MAQLKQKQNYDRKHSTPLYFKVQHTYNSKFYCYCQSQIGSSDCAWFTVLAKGILDQSSIRRHIHHCLTFADFPTK